MGKSTKGQMMIRVEAVAKLIALGKGTAAIRRHASESGWNVCERQLQRYQAMALELLHEHGWFGREEFFVTQLAHLQGLFETARDQGDLRGASAMLKEICKLLDLYPKAGKTELLSTAFPNWDQKTRYREMGKSASRTMTTFDLRKRKGA